MSRPRPACFFASWDGAGPCDGRLVRAHLVKQQALKREGHAVLCADPRSWIVCCGGPMGNAGHHGQLDQGKLRIPVGLLPEGFLTMMEEAGMGWYVDKHYGEARS